MDTECWYGTKYAAGPLPADWLEVGVWLQRVLAGGALLFWWLQSCCDHAV